MYTSEITGTIKRIADLKSLQASIASGELQVSSDKVLQEVVWRTEFTQQALRAKLAKEYLEAMERVRYLTDIWNNWWEYGAPKDLNLVGAVLRRLRDAREELKASRDTIHNAVAHGAI